MYPKEPQRKKRCLDLKAGTRILRRVLIFANCSIFFALSSWGQVIYLPDFSDPSSLTINGDASVVNTDDGAVLRLAPVAFHAAGSSFFNERVDVTAFTSFVTFRITDPGGPTFDCNTDPGADGIVFIIQPANPSAIGESGEGMGYKGIPNSVGVEFDTWCNGGNGSPNNHDPSSNHLGIDTNGSVDHGPGSPHTTSILPSFDDGQKWYAWIDYDGTTLEVRVSQMPVYPIEPQLTRDLDIASIIGGGGSTIEAFVGFSSGTGSAWGNHDILEWTFENGEQGRCRPSLTNLCLSRGRFKVEIDWQDLESNTGAGQVVPFRSDDSGLFWFFNADNWEMLVKVLDGCGINSHFWVFAAATTNVEYTLRVTDTESGAVKEYVNPLGVAAPAITDTEAFATCP